MPWIKLHDKASYVSRTKEFDDIAMTYLGYALFPLVSVLSIVMMCFSNGLVNCICYLFAYL